MSQALPESVNKISNKTVKELLHSVRKMQNGDISRIMNRLGLLYRYNFGVSIPQLRELANTYEPNQEIANLLFKQNIREAKILSAIFCEPEKLNLDDVISLSNEINNQELVEQFSKNVFSKLTFLDQVLNHWIQGSNWNIILAFYSIGWKFKTENTNNLHLVDWMLNHASAVGDTDDILVQQAIGFAIQSISSKSDVNKAKMTALAEKMMTSEKKPVRHIAEEYLWINAI